MPEWLTMMSAVLSVFGVIVIGAAVRRGNWLTEEADATLLKLVIRLLLPALIFHAILGKEQLKQLSNLTWPPLVGFVTVALGLGLALLTARWLAGPLRLREARQQRTFAFGVGIYNYGYVPLPLAMVLFDGGKVGDTVGVLFLHNLGVEIALWTLGVVVLGGAMGRRWWLRLFNPPSIAIVVALALNLAGLDTAVPTFIQRTIEMLGQCAIPMGLLLIGATVADHLRDAPLLGGGRVITAACVLRLGVLPVLFLLIGSIVPGSIELKRVIALEAAMPAAAIPIVLAKHYGGDVTTAVRVALATSLVSLATMSLWLSAGFRWLGLE